MSAEDAERARAATREGRAFDGGLAWYPTEVETRWMGLSGWITRDSLRRCGVDCGTRVVASGTLLLERKFTRNCGTCGHIEDVVVDSNERGKDLGRVIIEALTKAAEFAGCYKVILDCSEANAGFYERCGYVRKEIQMAKYFV